MRDLGLLVLRATMGGLLAGHGVQKLFGALGGPGLDGTAAMLESLDVRPGRRWAPLAGLGELGGGMLTALGLFTPLGPVAILSVMTMATLTAHRGKPIWGTAGGAELPVTNGAIALAVALAGPGRFSLDALLGTRLPARLAALALGAAGAGVALALGPRARREARLRGVRPRTRRPAGEAMGQPETAEQRARRAGGI